MVQRADQQADQWFISPSEQGSTTGESRPIELHLRSFLLNCSVTGAAMGAATGRSMGIAVFYWSIELPIEPIDLPSTVLFNGLCTRPSKGHSFQQANQQAAQLARHNSQLLFCLQGVPHLLICW